MKKNYLFSLALTLIVSFTLTGQNLVINGDFENWTDGVADNWLADGGAVVINQNTTTVQSGSSSCEVTWTSQDNQYLTSDPFDVTAGIEINANFWAYDNDIAGRARLCIIYEGADNYYGDYSSDMDEWQQLTYSDIVPEGATSAKFQIRFYDVSADWDGDATVIVDNVVFEQNTTVYPEPSNYPTEFVATAAGLGINVVWTASTGDQLPTGYLVLGEKIVDNSFDAPVDGVPVENDMDWSDNKVSINVIGDVQVAFDGLDANTSYLFTIYPFTNSGTDINYKTDGDPPYNMAITANLTSINTEGFDGDLATWTWIPYNVLGDQVWEWADGYGNPPGCAKMTGYDGGAFDNEDWLISPSLDLTEYEDITFGFEQARNYASNDGLFVKISTDYDGTSDPSTSGTWTDISDLYIWHEGGWDFIDAGTVDISEYSSATTHIAFVFTSTTDGSATWELDNLNVLGVLNTGIADNNISKLNVYPNPATSKINIESNTSGTLTIVSTTGKLLINTKLTAGSNSINIETLNSGLYIIETIDNNGLKSIGKLTVR